MESSRVRLGAGVVVVAVAVVLFIVLQSGSSSSPTSAGKLEVINIKNAKPVGGIKKLTYTKGQLMQIKVNSDVSDEVHMHGYDIPKNVKAGGSVTFKVPATIEGVFEMELESRHEQIAQLTINP